MKKRSILLFSLLLGLYLQAFAQTSYTSNITNPSFETGDGSGWTWTGTSGYAWIGPNNDGDATKDGTYINGLWNSSIGDAECSQVITGLPEGNYLITALVSVSTNRLTNQRLFVTSDGTTKSMLYGADNHAAYSTGNLTILGGDEEYTFGGYGESSAENGPFYELSVLKHVVEGSLTLGIRVSGKSTSQGYDFSHTSKEDAGFFKFDHFTVTEVSDVATLDFISLNTGFLDSAFDENTFTYTATLPEGTTSVTPIVKPTVTGVSISGDDEVQIASGTGLSTITVTALNGTSTQTYTIEYTVNTPEEGAQQDKLYTNEFPLGDITLLDGPFKEASELNIQTLLQYDADRLLAPYLKEAGLTPKASSYSNWIGLDGHIGGHYLSAMAINYAATGNVDCKNLMDYMVTELKACQDANTLNFPTWGVGYTGGVPSSSSVWSTFKTGNFSNYNSAWVPWYNLHKAYAGLRDAWLYGGNVTAKGVFLSFCDWAIDITSGLNDTQMETMLNVEHGGMNEVLADAYQMTGQVKYLTAAKRFSHKVLLNSMASGVDNLDNMHANTQVPKAVGFQRIAEVSKESNYVDAGEFFWKTVTENRSLALGGNSRKEYFPQASACGDYITDIEGPESCNTNNMLKLTEDLFRTNVDAKYAEYYEKALYNHILSTIHPEHGGYVYFTPARPRHYRVYSAPNEAMWCCVGTGMENHGKYGEFIYTHVDDSLYVNLFIASELNWRAKGVTVRQETDFPNEEKSRLYFTAEASTDLNLMIRYPHWVAEGDLKVVVNTDTITVTAQPQSYVSIDRTWSNNDSVHVLLPMQNTIEELPNVSEYVAVMHGPILLGAKTGTEDLAGLVADNSRWGHIANGSLLPLDQAPVIVSSREDLTSKIVPIEGETMKFTASDLFPKEENKDLILEPFYNIHDSRYMMYWLTLTEDQYQDVLDSLAAAEQEALELQARTIDEVATGEQQPEVDHNMQTQNSYTGNYQNEFWRDARDGGFISYDLSTAGKSDLSLMVRYWGNESGSRSFNIYIDDELLITENVVGKWNVNEFVNQEYDIPNSMTSGKETITVKFQAINSSNVVGGLFYVRLLEPLNSTGVDKKYSKETYQVAAKNKTITVSGLDQPSTIKVYDINGRNLSSIHTDDASVDIPCNQTGLKLVQVIVDSIPYIYKVIIYN
ncbi:beta-L-arabinofuranosidase domain-containing protein [Carboxylicivirga linearis]|uniref:Glycoside hydrolase family 127 protein n=1 Tax=Carboxylicivirga linearis TaxID=1628157 RepID=A0ABS5JPH9_9BACT|nr:beta-L-arabinofuranosidase domain-containing protein [Carboxylicivirga linearis]MBS2096729.1 glycoside hydrolase family 127 protein [Carboxylicivirga linearis]